MTQLHDLTAVEQRDALRRGELKSTELCEHYLERIERHDQALGAFVRVTPDLARQEAADADAALAEGDERPLLGLPIGFKDIHPVARVPITMGSAAMDPITFPIDGWTVGLLRQAGVAMLGTTHAPEYGAPCFTHSDVVGRPAVTPYDVTRTAGGSSGGAAAAVAAGLLPLAHGSDGAGSIRIPAAACGLVGLKPTRGRVSTAPMPSFQSWSTEGPLARTIADAALLMDVMANPPAGELHPVRRTGSFLAAASRSPDAPLRIAAWTESGRCVTDASAITAVEETAAALRGLGHAVIEVPNPTPWTDELLDMFLDVFAGLASNLVSHTIAPERRPQLQEFTQWLCARGVSLSAADYVAATDGLAALAGAYLTSLDGFDATLTPVTNGPAVPVRHFHAEGPDQLGARMIDWAGFNQLQNLSGVPAISLPVHVTSDGLPVAAQITATRHGDDALLLSLGGQLESLFDWQHRHPVQWNS